MRGNVCLDHLVVAARTLGEGAAWLEARLGVSLQPGGRHAHFGTHNRLLGLGDCYLEVIAVDPDAPPPPSPRWFELDTLRLDTPRLIHWIVGVPDLDATLQLSPRIQSEVRNNFLAYA